MNHRKNLVTILALLPLAFSAAALADGGAPTAERAYREAAFHRAFEWREPAGDGSASGLYLMDMVPAGMVQRVLVEDPAGRQVRITQSLDVRRGVQTTELLDDATGWQARMELDFGFRAETLGAFFAADEARSKAAEPAPLRLRFAADGAPAVETEVAATDPAAVHAAVAEAVRASAAGALVAGLPEGLAEAVLFLDGSLSPEPLESRSEGDNLAHGARGVVEVLAAALRAAPPEGLDAGRWGTRWPMTVRPIERGTSSSDPMVLEFVSRFRSVQNADPLADRPAAEAFGDPPPSS